MVGDRQEKRISQLKAVLRRQVKNQGVLLYPRCSLGEGGTSETPTTLENDLVGI